MQAGCGGVVSLCRLRHCFGWGGVVSLCRLRQCFSWGGVVSLCRPAGVMWYPYAG